MKVKVHYATEMGCVISHYATAFSCSMKNMCKDWIKRFWWKLLQITKKTYGSELEFSGWKFLLNGSDKNQWLKNWTSKSGLGLWRLAILGYEISQSKIG